MNLNHEITHEEAIEFFEATVTTISLFVFGIFSTLTSVVTFQAFV